MKTKNILKEFEEAESTEQRRRVLERHELGWSLPDKELPHYYKVDPEAVREYVDQQIEMFARWDDVPNTGDFRAFLNDHDPEYAAELFRKTCLPEEWKARVKDSSATMSGDALLDELEFVHPENQFGFPGGEVFELLLREHGNDVRDYVLSHADEPWGNAGWESLTDLIAEQEDWKLWDALVSGQPSQDFDRYVRWVLYGDDESEEWARRRLTGIAGASYVTWRGRATARLGDEVATGVYRRFPDLLTSVFDEHVHTATFYYGGHAYANLTETLLDAGDYRYLDRLTGKFLSRALYVWGDNNRYESTLDHFKNHYSGIDDDAAYAERTSRVLSAFQPEPEDHWWTLRRNNPLYELFFEHPERFASRPELITDLLESSYAAVRALGFRALVATGSDCGQLAAENVQLVLAAPLDRLPAAGMRAALEATRAMTDHEPSLGSVVLNRLREASSLAYPSFSKGELVRTMGVILHQLPELRRGSERPVIYDNHTAKGGHW